MELVNTPEITIGIMTHNYGRFIKDAIDSVVNQSFKNWELIISDDASDDGTEKIVAEYLSDPRISYVKHPINLGQAKNWAFLLNSGVAPIFAVLHADDYWLHHIIENAIQGFQDVNTDIICYNWLTKNNENETKLGPNKKCRYTTGMQELKYQLGYNTFLPSAVFLRRTLIGMVEPPNSTLILAIDTEYFIRLCIKAKFVKIINAALLIYRVHENSATIWGVNNRFTYDEQEYFASLVISHLQTLPHSTRLYNKFTKRIAKGFILSAFYEVGEGHTDLSLVYLKKALKYDKWGILNFKLLSVLMVAGTGKLGYKLFLILKKIKIKVYSHSKVL